MAKKEPTAKQLAARKAASERMKAMHAEKKARKENTVVDPPAPVEPEVPEREVETPEPQPNPVQAPTQGVTLTQEQFQMMLDALANRQEPQASQETIDKTFDGQAPTLNTQGGVVGVIERFPVDAKHYVNPVEQLYDVPELRRFGLRENFVLDWAVRPVKYQTAMGTWYIEPRFELTLKKKQYDEDNNELVKFDGKGQPYHPRLVLGRASFFEDPPANIMEAEEAGVSIDDLDKPEFQEKMRMYRYKFWLMERLSPKKPQFTTSNRREEVIGGKAYEIDEYSHPI